MGIALPRLTPVGSRAQWSIAFGSPPCLCFVVPDAFDWYYVLSALPSRTLAGRQLLSTCLPLLLLALFAGMADGQQHLQRGRCHGSVRRRGTGEEEQESS